MTGRLGAELLNENWMLLLLGIQKFLELIYVSVLTGYIFAYILNREPKIVLPQKLVIRHRTSENVEKLLTLGILVGNKSRFNLHNVCCTVTCYYLKNKKNPKLTNGEFQIRQEVHKLENYYRFSFDLKEFPSKILKDFIEKDPVCLEIDSINVSISGNANLLGNTFMVDRKYKLSDIVIDEHIPVLKNDIRTPFIGKKLYQIIKWKELDRTEEVSETKRNKIINEINTIIVGKIKKKQDITVRRTSSLKNSRIINIPIFHIGWITVPRTSVCRRKPTAGS
jgi:hypothetical protein